MASPVAIETKSSLLPSLTFSPRQEKAMTLFFQHQIGTDAIYWNDTPPYDPLWQRCILILIRDYARYICLNPYASSIAQSALHELIQRKESGDLKHFFCEHVLTSIDQIPDRLAHFIDRLEMNQDVQYICPIPRHRNCIVKCSLLAENHHLLRTKKDNYFTKSRALHGRLEMIRETDLLLDISFHEGKAARKKEEPVRHWYQDKSCTAECVPFVVLPSTHQQQSSAIIEAMQQAFARKVKQIDDGVETKRRLALFALSTVVALGAICLFKMHFTQYQASFDIF